MADAGERVSGAYATVAPRDGIAVYGTADSLMGVAKHIRSDGVVGLARPPEEIVEVAALHGMRVVPVEGPVELRVVDGTVEVRGSSDCRARLAAGIESLAATPPFGGVVARHIDVGYFPGHPFLSENSAWMTVTLLATPEA
jgi:hypothetical protein